MALLVAIVPVGSSTLETFDSQWWGSLSEAQRIAAVQGGIAGYQQGYSSATMFGAGLSQLALSKAKERLAAHYPRFSHTFGYYSEYITDFYIRFPQASAVELGTFMECLQDAGFSCDEIGQASHAAP